MINFNHYQDRIHAGKILARYLSSYKNNADTLILALPRGGVPVAAEVARELHLPFDLFIVRKLGVPSHAELAFGAIASGNIIIYNQEIIKELDISKQQIDDVIENEKKELQRRERVYGCHHGGYRNKKIILIDDGIATGATMRAAVTALRQQGVKKIIIAVPVAPQEMSGILNPLVDEYICPLQPRDFQAVGAWYEEFLQTTDAEVQSLLKQGLSRN